MGFSLSAKDYMTYLGRVAVIINENRDYISGLDAATGDGDHWANLNVGFEKLIAETSELEQLNISDCLKRIGILMMNTIGGSSGVLYGGAYMAAGKELAGRETLDAKGLYQVLEVMLADMCRRGNSKPGFKTMIDALHPAVQAYREALEHGLEERALCEAVKCAAEQGAEATRGMEAMRGRAYYQPGLGLGHLDPGAVTMAYQIVALMEFIMENKLS